MIQDAYALRKLENRLEFAFVSEGRRGQVLKLIRFDEVREGFWNLAFGDAVQGELRDSVVSNNNDVAKVLNTVALAVYEFFYTHPAAKLVLMPVDERRRRLYNAVFRRRQQEIETTFRVLGGIGDRVEAYNPANLYDVFILAKIAR